MTELLKFETNEFTAFVQQDFQLGAALLQWRSFTTTVSGDLNHVHTFVDQYQALMRAATAIGLRRRAEKLQAYIPTRSGSRRTSAAAGTAEDVARRKRFYALAEMQNRPEAAQRSSSLALNLMLSNSALIFNIDAATELKYALPSVQCHLLQLATSVDELSVRLLLSEQNVTSTTPLGKEGLSLCLPAVAIVYRMANTEQGEQAVLLRDEPHSAQVPPRRESPRRSMSVGDAEGDELYPQTSFAAEAGHNHNHHHYHHRRSTGQEMAVHFTRALEADVHVGQISFNLSMQRLNHFISLRETYAPYAYSLLQVLKGSGTEQRKADDATPPVASPSRSSATAAQGGSAVSPSRSSVTAEQGGSGSARGTPVSRPPPLSPLAASAGRGTARKMYSDERGASLSSPLSPLSSSYVSANTFALGGARSTAAQPLPGTPAVGPRNATAEAAASDAAGMRPAGEDVLFDLPASGAAEAASGSRRVKVRLSVEGLDLLASSSRSDGVLLRIDDFELAGGNSPSRADHVSLVGVLNPVVLFGEMLEGSAPPRGDAPEDYSPTLARFSSAMTLTLRRKVTSGTVTGVAAAAATAASASAVPTAASASERAKDQSQDGVAGNGNDSGSARQKPAADEGGIPPVFSQPSFMQDDALARNLIAVALDHPAFYIPSQIVRQMTEFAMEYKATYSTWEKERRKLKRNIPQALRRMASRQLSEAAELGMGTARRRSRSTATANAGVHAFSRDRQRSESSTARESASAGQAAASSTAAAEAAIVPLYVRFSLTELTVRMPMRSNNKTVDLTLRDHYSFLVSRGKGVIERFMWEGRRNRGWRKKSGEELYMVATAK